MKPLIYKFLAFVYCNMLVISQCYTQQKKDFIDYINNTKTYDNVLFLGMFQTQEEADIFFKTNPINPATLQKYDKVFAFGKDNKIYEVLRVIDDNLGSKTYTNYERNDLQGLRIKNLTTHSNGNDVAVNLLREKKIFVENWLAESPPRGFESNCANLNVDHIDIRYAVGDKVDEWYGKGIIPGVEPLQKAGFELTAWLGGFKFTKKFGDNNKTQTITSQVYDDPIKYIIDKDNPHSRENMDNNYIIEKMEEGTYNDFNLPVNEYDKIVQKFPDAVNQFNTYQFGKKDLGGVLIKPKIVYTKENSDSISNSMIKSYRPSQDSLVWNYSKPK